MKRLLLFVVLILSLPAFAARQCSNGAGSDRMELPGGYIVDVAPAMDDAHAGQCHAAITSPDNKVIYELIDREIMLNPVSGKDVNGDGKPDVVIESHPPQDKCCWNYFVLTPGEATPLIRQFTTSVPLNFEDRLGDGKMVIWTRDFAYEGVDGYSHSDSPAPLVFFRMKGAMVYPVDQLFWSEYESDINEAKSGISKSDVDELTKLEGPDAKPGHPNDPKDEHMKGVRALVLAVAINYLYAGKGQECWNTISEMWPLGDRQRIRQLILSRRSNGIMKEITSNAAAPAAGQSQSK